jgi:hypothetical protein
LLGAKLPGYKGDHVSPSSAEVKYMWSYTSTLPQMPSRHGAKLNTGQLYLYLLELTEAMCLENRAKFENVKFMHENRVLCRINK